MPVIPDCWIVWIQVAYLALGTSPVTVTLPLTTETEAPVQPAFRRSSVILPVRAGSAAAGVATGKGLVVTLLVTDLMPSMVFADASAFVFTVMSATSPVNVAT